MKQDKKLGQRWRDRVSGFEGIVTARYEYMNGCVRYEISGSDKDGQPVGYAFDHEQLEQVDGATVERLAPTRTGGPRDNRPAAR